MGAQSWLNIVNFMGILFFQGRQQLNADYHIRYFIQCNGKYSEVKTFDYPYFSMATDRLHRSSLSPRGWVPWGCFKSLKVLIAVYSNLSASHGGANLSTID